MVLKKFYSKRPVLQNTLITINFKNVCFTFILNFKHYIYKQSSSLKKTFSKVFKENIIIYNRRVKYNY